MNSKVLLAGLALVGAAACGPAFAAPNSTQILYSLLFSFSNGTNPQTPGDGDYPYGSVVLGSDGALYGETEEGGARGRGTLFRLDPNSGTFQTLASLGPSPAGTYPIDANGLVEDNQGNWYGTTEAGGSSTS